MEEQGKTRRIVSADTTRPDRVPPGQRVIDKFPVLTQGETPHIDAEKWTFTLFGLIEKEIVLTHEQFMALPKVEVYADFHCVTTWSRLGNLWEGVAWKDILSLVRLPDAARHVMIHCEQGYTTNVPLADMARDDVLFAYKHDGSDLSPEHGWPLRLIVPGLYAWKSAKWVRGVEFMEQSRPGFWEMNGYHIHGDPWNEERYGGQGSL